jgi:hypothetical protein
MTNLTPSPTNLLATETPLFRIGDVVAGFDLDLLAEDAARGVDVFDRHLNAVRQLRAESGVGAGDRPGHPEFDLRVGVARAEGRR